jgi:hypothetical protein
MPVKGTYNKVDEDGVQKDAFIVTFTNGAKDQIEELKNFFKKTEDIEVITLAISFMQKIKEIEEKKSKNGTEKSDIS